MKHRKIKILLFSFISLILGLSATAQEEEARELLLDIGYFMPADNIPYIKVMAREKVGRQFLPQNNITVNVYLGEEAEGNLMEKVITNYKGEARAYIPVSLKTLWDSLQTANFIAVSEATKDFESVNSELEITKARLEIDTLTEDDIRSVVVKITQLSNGEWIPAEEVDLKVMVQRSLRNLPVSGDDDIYTTDETGTVAAEFLRDSLFGDKEGDLTIIARTEDNDLFGNIFASKIVNWGKAPVITSNFNKRSLWAPRFRTPYW